LKLYNLPFFDFMRAWYMKGYYKTYEPDLVQALKYTHDDERCFMVGTGPSLTDEQLDRIRSEITFGTNTAYKLFFKFTYYCVSDQGVWAKHKKKILEEDTQLLLSGHAGRDYLLFEETYKPYIVNKPVILKDLGDIKREGWKDKDLTHGTYWGNTIMVDCALQVAYWMGFKEVYLIGCDCNYKGSHHFDGERFYFQTDTPAYYDQHWKKVFEAHKIIKEGFENKGRKIYNATPGGDLEVYDRVKLEDIV